MLKRAAAVGPALAVAQLAGAAEMTTLAIGEEGGKRKFPPRKGKPGLPTTRAIGEEGGRPRPSPKALFERYSQAFETALKAGDIEDAAKHWRRLTAFSRVKPFKPQVADARKRLGEKLAEVLKQADADLEADKLVEAVKAYRALSRIGGFPEQAKARKQQLAAAKRDGYKEALREVQAQELYDSACKADPKRRPALLKRIATTYEDTPTGKKAAEELKRLLENPPKATTQAPGEEGSGKKPPPRATTLAVGEEG